MHAMHDELDIRKMGGFIKDESNFIYYDYCFFSISRNFPLGGFFSKDKILEAAFNADATILWAILWITAGLTTFYSFRLKVMKIFFGKQIIQ